MTETRIYIVRQETDGKVTHRLVEATSQATAIRHCVKDQFMAGPALPKDLAKFMSEGLKVEKAEQAQQTSRGEGQESKQEEGKC